ncbi:MAG TPA: CapA family protein [Prolixibacteraceae bacterium]|nr:CapA family protein [Prolixibacteraceae bacterium]
MKIITKYGLLIQLILCFVIAIIDANAQTLDSITFQKDSSYVNQDSLHITFENVDMIINSGKNYLGKPYRYKMPDGKILDCSGFVYYILHAYSGFDFPRTSASLASVSKQVSFSEINKGDLMFFKGRNINSEKVGHVSMVTSVDGDIIEMMHSCRRGIVLEKYNSNRYYTSRFMFAGRLPQVALMQSLTVDLKENLPDSKEVILDSIKINIEENDTIVNDDSINIDTVCVEPKSVKIIGVGDIMLGTNFPDSSYLPPNDGKYILHPVKEIISKGDVSFANLEGVLLSGEGTVKKCSDPKVCYAFKMPDHYVDYLVEAGFNLLSVANNHIRDFGSTGTANTIRILKEAGIPHAGLEEIPYTTFEKDGITYGFAAFAPNSGTIRINDYANARKIISHLDTISDIVIVSFHGGAEGATKNHITREKEMFLGENRGNPYEFARMAIDAGADVIFGHGPHVTRAVDLYKDRFIAYSLGNFATYGRFNLSGISGISPIIELDLDTNGKFIKGKIYSTKQIGEGGPVIDHNDGVLKEIIKLTKVDIPECNLIINSDGSISKRVESTIH